MHGARTWRSCCCLALAGGLLVACAGTRTERAARLPVATVAQAVHCPAADAQPWLRVFAAAAPLRDWQRAHGLESLPETAGEGVFVALGSGVRQRGGHELEVAPEATLASGHLRLQARFIAPPAGSMTVQMLTSPCVILRLPALAPDLRRIEVYDDTGVLRASQDFSQPIPADTRP